MGLIPGRSPTRGLLPRIARAWSFRRAQRFAQRIDRLSLYFLDDLDIPQVATLVMEDSTRYSVTLSIRFAGVELLVLEFSPAATRARGRALSLPLASWGNRPATLFARVVRLLAQLEAQRLALREKSERLLYMLKALQRRAGCHNLDLPVQMLPIVTPAGELEFELIPGPLDGIELPKVRIRLDGLSLCPDPAALTPPAFRHTRSDVLQILGETCERALHAAIVRNGRFRASAPQSAAAPPLRPAPLPGTDLLNEQGHPSAWI